MTQNKQALPLFSDLGIAPKLLSILESRKFLNPTPIQHQVIPIALEGKDVVGIAQTGTGKTLAFGIPLVQQLAINEGQALIMLPTRELALQVDEVMKKIGSPLGMRTTVLIGGAPIFRQIQELRRGPHVIIATPGRLIDHMQQKTISLNKIKIVVLDEADRMFDIGFAPQIKQIMNTVPHERQTLLFSATMSLEVSKLAAGYMRMPLRIEVAPSGTTAANVEQEVFIVNKEAKMQLLEKTLVDYKGSVLVFSRTKHGARKIAAGIRTMGHTAVEIHSNRSLAQRRAALEGFKLGRFRVLVATDIAARGIDVTGISLVINYDLPDNSDDYVHRIGRTARAGSSGKAISFASPDQRNDIRQIERLIRKTLPVKALPILPPRRAPAAGFIAPFQNRNFSSRTYRDPRTPKEQTTYHPGDYKPRRRQPSPSRRFGR